MTVGNDTHANPQSHIRSFHSRVVADSVDPVTCEYKMKFTLATLLSLATTASAHLRKEQPSVKLSACNKVTDQSSCFQTIDDESGLPCAWCVAGAIPSECVTQEQAKQLPESVFECSIPGEVVYSFVQDQSHTFYSKDGNDLCDASSKSISGYMDIKGSEYDKNGQNKHLFYWMFEKRGHVDENTPFIVRFSLSLRFVTRAIFWILSCFVHHS